MTPSELPAKGTGQVTLLGLLLLLGCFAFSFSGWEVASIVAGILGAFMLWMVPQMRTALEAMQAQNETDAEHWGRGWACRRCEGMPGANGAK